MTYREMYAACNPDSVFAVEDVHVNHCPDEFACIREHAHAFRCPVVVFDAYGMSCRMCWDSEMEGVQ